ncbi:hypothetical protein GS944_03410 [Rhodococcus hoagii]|nr:hypothetical protein [Prescottella equi]
MPKPSIGIDIGRYYWPVEAAWEDQRIVLVEGEDPDRDKGLGADGYKVYRVDDTDVEQLVGVLGAG